MIIFIGIAFLVLTVWYVLVKLTTYWSKRGVPQYKLWSILGDFWPVILKRVSIVDLIHSMYNSAPNSRYVGIYQFTSPQLFVRDPELIKTIMVKDFDSFTDHPPLVDPDADPLWGKTLLALKGERWKEIRQVVTPIFTSSKIRGIYVLMTEVAQNFVEYFQKQDEEIIEVEMKETFRRFTNDIIATSAFGLKVDSLTEKNNQFFEMGKRITDMDGFINNIKFLGNEMTPGLFKILGIRFLDKKAASYFENVIDETIKIRQEKNIIRPDIINILLEAKKDNSKKTSDISNADIASQAVIFFFAGFDTVSTALSFTAYELAVNKDVQDRLREEIKANAEDGKVSYDALQEMKYLDMVVSEALRKWPPFPGHDRLVTKDYTIPPTSKDEKPLRLYKGQEVFIPVCSLQRDPKYFPNPDKFDPERFLDENKDKLVPYAYMPFGAGPRICIGNRFALIEVKAMLFNLLLNFELVPTKKTPIPPVLAKEIFPRIEGGCWLGLKRIQS